MNKCKHADRKVWAKGLCKSCYETKRINSSGSNKIKRAKYLKKYAAANKSRLKLHAKKYRRNPEIALMKRLAQYGMTLERYNFLLTKQDSCCAICKHKPKRTLHIDHCHRTGATRLLLCAPCNWYLGKLENKKGLLSRLADYTLLAPDKFLSVHVDGFRDVI